MTVETVPRQQIRTMSTLGSDGSEKQACSESAGMISRFFASVKPKRFGIGKTKIPVLKQRREMSFQDLSKTAQEIKEGKEAVFARFSRSIEHFDMVEKRDDSSVAETARSVAEEAQRFVEDVKRIRQETPEMNDFEDDYKDALSSHDQTRILSDIIPYARSLVDALTKHLNTRRAELAVKETERAAAVERLREAQSNLERESELCRRRLMEHDETAILCEEKAGTFRAENDSLRMQVHGLRQALSASGAGDVSAQLADLQEKIAYFRAQYYQLLSEKNGMLEQRHAHRTELEEARRGKINLEKEVEIAGQKIAALQLEKTKLLDEKNVMRQIYERLKAEIEKVDSLKGTIAGMNAETNRLSLIAEYNQQLGERLQTEVSQRDEKISELQCDVHELNAAQVEQVRDKVALCAELRDACSLNERLVERQHDVESCAAVQLAGAQEMMRQERAALRELLDAYKEVVEERDNLKVQLKNSQKLHEEAATVTTSLMSEKCNELKTLQEQLNFTKRELDEAKKTVEVLESSKSYLQCTAQRLQAELDTSRHSTIELQLSLKSLTAENVKLTEKVTQSEKDVEDFQKKFDEVSKQHRQVSEALQELHKVSDVLANRVDNLQVEKQKCEETLVRKDQELDALEKSYKTVSAQLERSETVQEDSDGHSKKDGQKMRLRKQAKCLRSELDKAYRKMSRLEIEKTRLEGRLRDVIDDAERKYVGCRVELDELLRQCSEQRDTMKSSLQNLTTKLEDTKNNLINEHHAHSCLLSAHKDLAGKLLKAVHLLIDEKLFRQQAESHLAGTNRQLETTLREKNLSDEKIAALSTDLFESKERIEELLLDKQTLQEFVVDLQKLHEARKRRSSSTGNNSTCSAASTSSSTLLKQTHERAQQLGEELDESHRTVIDLKSEIAALKQQMTSMEFEKSESSLRLHEFELKLKGEQCLNAELYDIQKKMLDEVLALSNDGNVPRNVCDRLIKLMQLGSTEVS